MCRPGRKRARPERDRGAVTVEAAISVCALVVLLAMLLTGIGAVIDQLRCTDAAREAARLVARGEQHRARQAVERIGPRDARLRVSTSGDEITVRVSAEAAGGLLPGVRLRAEAYAVAEPAAEPGHRTGDEPGRAFESGG